MFWLFGPEILPVKIANALLGALAVVLCFLVAREAGAGEVEGIIRPQRNPRTVGEAGAAVGDCSQNASKRRQLLRVHRAIRFIGAGEVAHQNVDVERCNCCVICLACRNAEPVDAGVDHQVAPPAPACAPAFRLFQRVDHRHGPNRAGIGAFRFIPNAMQNRHLLRRDMGALVQVREDKVIDMPVIQSN